MPENLYYTQTLLRPQDLQHHQTIERYRSMCTCGATTFGNHLYGVIGFNCGATGFDIGATGFDGRAIFESWILMKSTQVE